MGPDGRSDPLDVLLLGPVEVRVDGRPVPLPGVSQRVVLARLAVAAGRLVPTGELVDALWPGGPPDNALGNLQSYLSRLRRVLGAERVTREPGGYRLVVTPEAVDVGRVEALVARAREVGDVQPGEAARLLGEALACWRGEPLADLPDALPFAPEVARWAAWRRQLVEDRLRCRIAAGQAADALPELEQAATADPTSERVHLLWMEALHHLGRTPDALRVADRFRRRLIDESGLDPSPALVDLERRLLSGEVQAPAPPPRPAAPPVARRFAPSDGFFGRAEELATLAAAVETHRVVTVVGPGGVGKTRLVLELLDRTAGRWPIHLVELGAVSEGGDVAVATAAALDLRSAPAGAEAAVVDRLAGEPALLVLDNCEHVLAAAAALVATVAARCPDVRVLATSRRRLGVAGERVERLGPLPEADQVALFGDRASLLRAGFDLDDPEVRAAVAEVCRLVDGLPLAVELSASREAVFGVAQLRRRLAAGLDVLDPPGPGDATRSTAVGAAVEWSYRLLDERARALFDRLAVCRGGFTLDGLAHFADPDGDMANPAAVLAELVEVSLVVAEHGPGPVRYRLLDTVRHVARGHLDEAGLAAAHEALTGWMLDVAERAGPPGYERAAQTDVLIPEAANLRDVLAGLVEAGRWEEAGRIAVPTALGMLVHPHLEVLAQLRRLEHVPDGPGAGACAIAAGAAAFLDGAYVEADRILGLAVDRLAPGDVDRWAAHYFRCVSRMFTSAPPAVEADALAVVADTAAPTWLKVGVVCCAALIRLYHGDREVARKWMDEHAGLLEEVGPTEGFVAFTTAELAADVDPATALAWYDEAERRCDEHGHAYVLQVSRIGRLALLIRTGRLSRAVPAALQLLDELRRLGMWPQLWTTMRLTAELLVALGDLAPAAQLLTAAEADPLAPPVAAPEQARHDELWRRIRPGVDPDELAAARAAAATGRSRAGAAVACARAALATHLPG